MANLTVAQFLTPGNYERFYQLAHHLSEEVLVRLVTISTRAHVLNLLQEGTPGANLFEPGPAAEIKRLTLDLHDTAKAYTEELRRFFWPRLAGEAGFETVNQERWKPYDGPAWDNFYAQFVQFLSPRLETLEALKQQLQQEENYGGVWVRPDGSSQVWYLRDHLPDEPYQQLRGLLIASSFEARVFKEK